MPNTRAEVPESPSDLVPAKPFSISSTQRMEGATASAVWMALRMFSSELPTTPPKILPMSSFSSGSPQMALMALAVRLLPQPGTPVISTPLGAGMR